MSERNYAVEIQSVHACNASKSNLHKLAYCMLRLHSPHKPCHHLQAQDCCNFCSGYHRHMLLSTRRTWTIRRPLQTRTRTRECTSLKSGHFDMPHMKDKNQHPHSLTPTSHTWTSLRVAGASCVAYTSPAAIRRRGVAASFPLSSAATIF